MGYLGSGVARMGSLMYNLLKPHNNKPVKRAAPDASTPVTALTNATYTGGHDGY